MFQIPNKLFDLLFYAAIGAILYFVLPVATDFFAAISGLNEGLVVAFKDLFLIWSAVYLASRHKCAKENNNNN
jgi:hypothetical protein